MLNQVHTIYKNTIGMSYQWNSFFDPSLPIQLKIAEVSIYDLKDFLNALQNTSSLNCKCTTCDRNSRCKAIQFKQGQTEIKIRVNANELNDICDLIQGTLFQLELTDLLSTLELH